MNRGLTWGLLAAGIMLGGNAAAWAARLDIEDLPVPVRRRIEEVLDGGRLTRVNITNEDGHVVYEAEMRRNGVARSFTVGVDGGLLARQVFTTELPARVRQAIERATAGARSDEIYWVNDEGEPCYYLEFAQAQGKRALTIGPDGWMISRQVMGAEIPPALAEAIRVNLAGRAPSEVDLADDGLEKSYEVTETRRGRDLVWIFRTNGTLAAKPVELAEMPEGARAALTRLVAGARFTHGFQFEEEGTVFFEAAWVRQGLRFGATVDAAGRLVCEELPLSTLPVPLVRAIQAQAGWRFLVRVERHYDGDRISYEAAFRSSGGAEVLTFSPEGEAIPPQPKN